MAHGLQRLAEGLVSQVVHLKTQRKENHMPPLCGYNSEMSSGLKEFTEGLAVQTEKRAVNEEVSLAQIPAIEMEEIDALLHELQTSPQRAELQGVVAVGTLIRFFYAKLEKELNDDPTQSAETVFSKIVDEQNRLLFGMENHYYRDLRPNFPRLEAIRRIRNFLETQVA
jgi:hypothetical protein